MRQHYRGLAYILYALALGLIIIPYVRLGLTNQASLDAAAAITPLALAVFFHIMGREPKEG